MDRNRPFLEGSPLYSICFEFKLCIDRKYSFVFEKRSRKTWKMVSVQVKYKCLSLCVSVCECGYNNECDGRKAICFFLPLRWPQFCFFLLPLLCVCPFSGFVRYPSLSVFRFGTKHFSTELQLLTYATQPYYMALAYIINKKKLHFPKKRFHNESERVKGVRMRKK